MKLKHTELYDKHIFFIFRHSIIVMTMLEFWMLEWQKPMGHPYNEYKKHGGAVNKWEKSMLHVVSIFINVGLEPEIYEISPFATMQCVLCHFQIEKSPMQLSLCLFKKNKLVHPNEH